MKLEAVVSCVKYGDILAHTLPYNRSLFDKLVVVTAPEDKATQRVCEYWHVQCVTTDRFQSHWDQFHKGAGLNVGLSQLDMDGWVCHMDADIVCPPLTRQVLERAGLDTALIYGADRFMVPSYQAWQKFISMPALLHENASWVHLSAFPLGVRVALDNLGGYLPIGFFQLWNPLGSSIKAYPEQHANAARGDLVFAQRWPRSKRALLPDLVVYHLESEPAAMGANWNGRTTVCFGPETDKPTTTLKPPASAEDY